MTSGGSSGSPITAIDALALLFVAFKLGGVGEVAGWSWWWVLAPVWIYIVLLTASKTMSRIVKRAAKNKAIKESLRRSVR